MAEHTVLVLPHQVIEVQGPVVEAPPAHAVPAQPIEQAQAVDHAFTAQERETQAALGLIGMYSAGMLLNDVLREHLSPKPQVEEERPRLEPHGPDA